MKKYLRQLTSKSVYLTVVEAQVHSQTAPFVLLPMKSADGKGEYLLWKDPMEGAEMQREIESNLKLL